MDVSKYSAIEMDSDEFIKDGEDHRWMQLQWDGLYGGDQVNRYRLVVDPDSGDIIFVDENTDVRQVIDARNLQVLVTRSTRRQQVNRELDDRKHDLIHGVDEEDFEPELMPYIRREGEIGVRIDTTMEQLHSLYIALKFYLDVRGNHEVPEWVEQLGRFFNDG